jgi:2-deoxy-D-gluconate 3-dehydrogenase
MKGKVCIVTGAGKGIGYDVAKLYYSLGCSVAVISRTRSDLDSLEKELSPEIGKFLSIAGDVSSNDVVQSFVDSVYSKFGKIDILVNNAGMRFRKEFLEISRDEFNEVLNTNLGSAFSFCQAVGPYMIEQKSGRIVNMASIVGTLGLAELVAYATSKGAIISLTKSLAIEWAKHNINVNVIAPGFCETSYSENFKKNTALYDFTVERTPAQRWGKASDIANACLYLTSEMSDYVTGEVLVVDGGWSAW